MAVDRDNCFGHYEYTPWCQECKVRHSCRVKTKNFDFVKLRKDWEDGIIEKL